MIVMENQSCQPLLEFLVANVKFTFEYFLFISQQVLYTKKIQSRNCRREYYLEVWNSSTEFQTLFTGRVASLSRD